MSEITSKSRDGYELDDLVVPDSEKSDVVSNSEGFSARGADIDFDRNVDSTNIKDEGEVLKETKDLDPKHLIIEKPRKSKKKAAKHLKALTKDCASLCLSDEELTAMKFEELPFCEDRERRFDEGVTGYDWPCECSSPLGKDCKYAIDNDTFEHYDSGSSITGGSPKTPKSSRSSRVRDPLSTSFIADNESPYTALLKAFVKNRTSRDNKEVPGSSECTEYKYGEPLDNSPFACRKRYLPYDVETHRRFGGYAGFEPVKKVKHS